MTNPLRSHRITLGFLAVFMVACSSGGGGGATPGTAGTTGTAGSGSGTGGAAGDVGTGTAGTGGNPVVVTPEGMLFMDDFESGAAKWNVTQGTCSIMADGTNVMNCINGGNEARALAGQIGWGEYSVQAKVKVNAMDLGRRIYLAARFTDSSNWYGAAIYNGTPLEVQIRKKVAGTSSDIARVPFAVTFGTWYTLKFEVKGSTLRLFVDGVLQIEASDTQFASGQVALLVDRSDVSWDDVVVTNP
jgi:hypothetical protein